MQLSVTEDAAVASVAVDCALRFLDACKCYNKAESSRKFGQS